MPSLLPHQQLCLHAVSKDGKLSGYFCQIECKDPNWNLFFPNKHSMGAFHQLIKKMFSFGKHIILKNARFHLYLPFSTSSYAHGYIPHTPYSGEGTKDWLLDGEVMDTVR